MCRWKRRFSKSSLHWRFVVGLCACLIAFLGQSARAHEGGFAELDFRNAPRGALPWGILSKVGVDRADGKLIPHFLPGVMELDGKTIVLYGYMTPRPGEAMQRQFLLSPRPVFGCDCAPVNPEEIVEIFVDKPVPRTGDPLSVRGVLALQPAAQDGVLYRLQHAKVVLLTHPSSDRHARGKRAMAARSK